MSLQVDSKGNNNGQYSSFVEERYGTMPTVGHYQNGQVFTDRPEEILGGTLNRWVMKKCINFVCLLITTQNFGNSGKRRKC